MKASQSIFRFDTLFILGLLFTVFGCGEEQHALESIDPPSQGGDGKAESQKASKPHKDMRTKRVEAIQARQAQTYDWEKIEAKDYDRKSFLVVLDQYDLGFNEQAEISSKVLASVIKDLDQSVSAISRPLKKSKVERAISQLHRTEDRHKLEIHLLNVYLKVCDLDPPKDFADRKKMVVRQVSAMHRVDTNEDYLETIKPLNRKLALLLIRAR